MAGGLGRLGTYWRIQRYKIAESLVKRTVARELGPAMRQAGQYYPHVQLADDHGERVIRYCGRTIGKRRPFAGLLAERPESIYLLGSGPSVKDHDLTRLRGGAVVGLNGSAFAALDAGVVPFLCVISDVQFVLNRLDLARRFPEGSRLLLALPVIKAMAMLAPGTLERCHVYVVDRSTRPYLKPDCPVADHDRNAYAVTGENDAAFTRDPEKGFYLDCATVMGVGMQLAWYLRVPATYCLGLDIANDKEPRFYETAAQRQRSHLRESYETQILPFMRLAARMFREAGLALYNCSPVSLLPRSVIDYRSYETATDPDLRVPDKAAP